MRHKFEKNGKMMQDRMMKDNSNSNIEGGINLLTNFITKTIVMGMTKS